MHPIVGLGQALAERGHAVTVATNPYFESLVGRVGLRFEPVGTLEQFHDAMANPNLWKQLRGFRVVVRDLILQARRARLSAGRALRRGGW